MVAGPHCFSQNEGSAMTDVSLPAGRFTQGDFRVGQVLSRAWRVFSRNFFTFIVVTGIASLPPILVQQPLPGGPPPADPFQNFGLAMLALLVAMVFNALAQGTVVYGAFEIMRGRPINLAESAKVGLRRFFPIVGLAIVVSFLVGLASILLFFPGVMLYTMWFVATPACVVERAGVFRSMGRSRELTKGHRWKVFGLYLVILIPALIIGGIIGTVILRGGAAAVNTALASTLGRIANLIWSAVWTAFFSILVVVTYHDLRVAKEGVDTDQIAAVFE
jgi:hypothetical protein